MSKPPVPRLRLLSLLPALLLFSAPLLGAASVPFTDTDESRIETTGDRWIVPDHYRAVALDRWLLTEQLNHAPLEGSLHAEAQPLELVLPLPEGGDATFLVVESPIMAPELQNRYPEIRTYRGHRVDEPATSVRFDVGPAGFHGMILAPTRTVYIDPYQRGDDIHHVTYDTADYRNEEAQQEFRCHTHADFLPSATGATSGVPNLPNGDTLKTYRLVVAATGEYTAFHSAGAPTVPEGLAAIVTAMNRVNGIYERDLAVRMTLVANNDLVIYTDGSTDPYTNNSGGAMLGQNQTNLTSVIGAANYDIGHVFSTGGGGIATLRVPCKDGSKARGVTGLSQPTGDVFWVDYVAHEMGHQWGGNHTFNGSSGACSGANRNPSTAYEPGSGTTIMAYAGICNPQNIQSNSDDHFHNASYQEIVNYITTSNGNDCDAPTATGNTPPTPDAGNSYTIPLDTPFELCGSATDPDGGDVLTFNWEQFNLGPAGHPNVPVGNAPIFRSFPSKLSPCRTFPQPSDIYADTQTIGEILPTYARTLSFRMLVRDNAPGGGGADYDEVDIVVTDAAGPFRVTSPSSAVTWTLGDSETILWDVADTDLPPVSCATVDLRLTTDEGETFVDLELGSPNDGSEAVTVPDVTSDSARVEVRCSGNVFFDVSDVDFNVAGTEIFSDGFESGDTNAW